MPRDGYAPVMARDTFDELSNDDFALAAGRLYLSPRWHVVNSGRVRLPFVTDAGHFYDVNGRIRRRKVDAESHAVEEVDAESVNSPLFREHAFPSPCRFDTTISKCQRQLS
jgi:hypothetical protein